MKPINHVTVESTDIFEDLVDTDFSGLVELIADHLTGTLDQGYFTGYSADSPAPNHDIGPWLRFGLWWWGWDGRQGINRYLPFPLASAILGNDGALKFTVLQSTTVVDNHIILNLPAHDHSGQRLLMLQEIPHGGGGSAGDGFETVSASGTEFNLNFEAHTRVVIEPSGDFSVNAVGGSDGDEIHLWVKITPGATIGVTWPDKWIIGAGVFPPASLSQYNLKHILIKRTGGRVFVNFKKNFIFGSGGVSASVTAPAIVSTTSINGSGVIDIEFDKILKGGIIASSDFLATRNTLSDGITSVLVTGTHVYVYVNNAYTVADTGEITYGGSTSIKDIDGNPAATFGPIDIEMRSAGIINRFQGSTGQSGPSPAGALST